MKRILVFANHTKSYETNRLREVCETQGFEFEVHLIKEVSLDLFDAARPVLRGYDGTVIDTEEAHIIVRNPVRGDVSRDGVVGFMALIRYLKAHSKYVLNGDFLTGHPNFEDKLYQSIVFSELIPDRMISTRFFNTSSEALRFFEKHDFANEHVLLKPRFASGGRDIIEYKSFETIRNKLVYEDAGKYIFQRFIPNDFDLRVIVSKEGVLGTMKRIRSEGIVNNVSQGGEIEPFELPEMIGAFCEDLLHKLGADYMGIDIIITDDSFYVLEINRYCHFKGFDQIYSPGVARKLVDWVINFS